MSTNSYNESTVTSIDMTDFDTNDNSPLTSSFDNTMNGSALTSTRISPNLASDWPSADCASGGWIDDHGMDDDEETDSDDPAEQEQFDRISGILSQLIQEANNAIQSSSSPGNQVSTPTMTDYDDDGDALLENTTIMDDYDGDSLVEDTTIMDDYDGDSLVEDTTMMDDYDDDSLVEDTTIMDDDNALVENTTIMESDDDVDHVDWSISTIDDIISETANDFNYMDQDTPIRSTSPIPIQLPLYEPHAMMMEKTMSASASMEPRRRRSRLPRPKKLSLETIHYSYHNRSSSIMSTSTSSSSNIDYDDDTLFSPVSSNLNTPMSRTISPLLFEKTLSPRQGSLNEAQLALLCGRAVQNQRDDDSDYNEYASHLQDNNDALMSPNGSLLASFERLDSSLAIVDSLSRDLANYRRQHPRQRNSTITSIHPMTRTGISTNPAVDTTTTSTTTTIPSSTTIHHFDANNAYSNQHYDHQTFGYRNWVTILLVGPILYIPYLLMVSLWEQIIVATGITTPSYSLLLSTVSAMIFDDRHTFASLKSTFITTITSTAVIGNDGGSMVPPCIGLAVFILFLAILHLLRDDCVTMDQTTGHHHGRQFMDTSSSYNDRSNKMIRRSSLPMVPCSPSLSRRNSF